MRAVRRLTCVPSGPERHARALPRPAHHGHGPAHSAHAPPQRLNCCYSGPRRSRNSGAMFLLLVLATGFGGLHARFSTHKNFLQITVPEKISSSSTKENPEDNADYIITLEEKQYFIHIKKQSFLSSMSIVYYYDKNDTQHHTPLKSQMDCNYNGYVSGFPNSLVTLNTCSGLRGTVQFKNISYGIEPMEAVSGFAHMIYEEKTDPSVIHLVENDTHGWLYASWNEVRKYPESTDFSKLLHRNIEIYIVVEKNLFNYIGSDTKTVTQRIIQIIGLANTMLTPLKLTLVITAIEIWSNKNRIPTTEEPYLTLYRFLEWKRKHLEFRSHDFAFLFSFKKQPMLLGASLPEKICNKDFAAGVAVYPEGFSLESYTVIIVQLLGLSLGLNYDSVDSCYCSGDVCTMMPTAIFSKGIKDFSTCSLDDFKYISSQSGLHCLQSDPFEMPVYKQDRPRKICGNSIMELDEQCDCGNIKNCTHKKCCDPTTCTLKSGKQCGSGDCCTKDCKVKPMGVKCRDPVDKQCDFPEFCNGRLPNCMPDTYVRNGEYCDGGDSFCHDGLCKSTTRQCKALIGGDSRGAPFPCFDEINARGDKFGNCGNGPCQFADLLCGKLICAWPHKRMISRVNLSVIYSHIQDDICVSTYLPIKPPANIPWTTSPYTSADSRDETFVQDGTICGPDMFCFRFSCRLAEFRKNRTLCDTSSHCNGHGICNNFEHCHCEKGYTPPHCKPKTGEFGSTDDGHFNKDGRSYVVGKHATFEKKHLHLILYITLPVLIIIGAVLMKQDKIRELCYRGETESDRSETEEISSSSKISSFVGSSP
nr:disintegrin and metalloproteinase domain-containing protein 5 isoform X1 [Oryctolagus cuniculus]